ncbi:hypothetical protein FB451DRAFT_1500739, partial [Mycena latifolia]
MLTALGTLHGALRAWSAAEVSSAASGFHLAAARPEGPARCGGERDSHQVELPDGQGDYHLIATSQQAYDIGQEYKFTLIPA